MQINVFYNIKNISPYYKATSVYKKLTLAALGRAAAKKGEVNVIIVDGKEILRINKQFLNHNYITDVISFNYPFDGGAGSPFGDIFVCLDMAKKQAEEEGHGAKLELMTLIAHGALHLVGWDDSTPELRTEMNSRAGKIAASFIK